MPKWYTPLFAPLRACLGPMGSRTQTTLQSVAQATLSQIEEQFGPALGPELLEKPAQGDHSRQRIFPLERTFWCWIWQILQGNTCCRHVVRQVQALFTLFTDQQLDEGTSAY